MYLNKYWVPHEPQKTQNKLEINIWVWVTCLKLVDPIRVRLDTWACMMLTASYATVTPPRNQPNYLFQQETSFVAFIIHSSVPTIRIHHHPFPLCTSHSRQPPIPSYMREKVRRRRIPANRRENTIDPGTPRSPSSEVRRRIKPDADRKFMESSKDVSILKRSKSEPPLLKGVGGSETEAVEKMAAEEDEGVLCRPVTWVDIFTSPEISAPRFPRKCYQVI